MPAISPTVSVIAATSSGRLSVQRIYGGLGGVLKDAGFRFLTTVDQIPDGATVEFGPEALTTLDADLVIDTYRNDRGEMPKSAHDRMAAITENYCQFLTACASGRYFYLPRDEAKSLTYAARKFVIRTIGRQGSVEPLHIGVVRSGCRSSTQLSTSGS